MDFRNGVRDVNHKLQDYDATPAHEEDDGSDGFYSDGEQLRTSICRPQVLCCLFAVAASAYITLLAMGVYSGGTDPNAPIMTPPGASVSPVVAVTSTQQQQMNPPLVVVPATTPQPQSTSLSQPTPSPTTARNPLLPMEDLHNGNVCDDTEELFAGLCYKKCGLLTMQTHPIRTSSWTCCEREPCTLANTKGSVGSTILCNGYDVGGAGGCPEQPGACLTNEERFMGVCYERCSELTGGSFPRRVGAASCCKSGNLLGCMNPLNDRSRMAFNTGGGIGDHDKETPASAHLPSTEITEADDLDGSALTPAATKPDPGAGGHLAAAGQCNGDEEMYAGLCYKKCSLLTGYSHPIRTSSWTCCANHPCGLTNQKGSIGKTIVCNGFDVGGSGALHLMSSLPCPHKPLACKGNEEMVLGTCYTKCSSLTGGEFPYRLAAATCCKEKGLRACLDISKAATSSQFDVAMVA
jgi:hypothetical protein